MATDAELRLILRANDQASAALDKVQGKLAGVGKAAEDIGKRFGGGQLFGSILSGLGIGSGMQIVQMIADRVVKPYKEAAEAAKIIESNSLRALDHAKRMMELRRGEISDAQRLAELQKEAQDARGRFDSANAPQYRIKSGFFGNFLGNELIEKTKEQQEELKTLQKQAEDAEFSVLKFSKAFEAAGIDAKLREFFDSVAAGAAAIDENLNTALRDFFYTLDNPPDLTGVNQELSRFFGSVEAGAEVIKDNLNTALRDFFYTIDNAQPAEKSQLDQLRDRTQNNPNALSVGQGAEFGALAFIDQVGSRGEQVAGVIQGTLGSAVYAVSDGIYSWVTGIGSAADAAYAFLEGALRSVIDMIVKIGLQQIINATIGRTVAAATAAATIAIAAPQALAMAGIWAAPATLATIASYGAAAAQAPLSIAAAKGAVIASSLAGFAGGGLVTGPGSGTSDSILARLSNGEFVVPAAAVQRIGERNLDAMAYGAASASAAGSSSGGGGFGRSTTVLVDSRREADRFRRGSPMETQIVQVMQANRYRVAHT